jgi:hypothetical protein
MSPHERPHGLGRAVARAIGVGELLDRRHDLPGGSPSGHLKVTTRIVALLGCCVVNAAGFGPHVTSSPNDVASQDKSVIHPASQWWRKFDEKLKRYKRRPITSSCARTMPMVSVEFDVCITRVL